ncbi:unnamed protein product [Pleuronectes platessa]|uniref:Uncharacterized protein n=1 Tax=Pleuronectes platessa TaxID=8262 RepID=A0A9N7V3G1_PLEPL|nr:unnamed protein product [Pleuronectes platessa]
MSPPLLTQSRESCTITRYAPSYPAQSTSPPSHRLHRNARRTGDESESYKMLQHLVSLVSPRATTLWSGSNLATRTLQGRDLSISPLEGMRGERPASSDHLTPPGPAQLSEAISPNALLLRTYPSNALEPSFE